MEAALWGGLVRFVQAMSEGAPTFLVGLVVAGIFRRLIGPAGTRKLFGGSTIRSLLQSWGIGMLLPVCSLGVIRVENGDRVAVSNAYDAARKCLCNR